MCHEKSAMKVAQANLFFVPGNALLGDTHWLYRWQTRLKTAHLVTPDLGQEALGARFNQMQGPLVVIAQEEGVDLALRAAHGAKTRLAGAFFIHPHPHIVPREKLEFPAVLVASRTHPRLRYDDIDALAKAWEAPLLDGADAGALDEASGHGPWPEGLLKFAHFLQGLPA